MKKLLFVFVLGAFAACGGNGGSEAVTDSSSVSQDTLSNSATMGTDAAGGAATSDTTTMSTSH